MLTFADGTCVEADVVIGADGVHSTVRGAVTEPSPATYSGMCAFRAIVPVDRAPAFSRRREQTLWIGPGHHFVHYPISGESAINLVAGATPLLSDTAAMLERAMVRPVTASYPRVSAQLQAMLEAVLTGRRTPTQAARHGAELVAAITGLPLAESAATASSSRS